VPVEYRWRGPFENTELNRLHGEGFGTPGRDGDWRAQVEGHSLGWVAARDAERLIGFVNVAWDGGAHAFLLDTVVTPDARHRGVAKAMIAMAVAEARAAGCEWLHADYGEELIPFYIDACGFAPTPAGVIAL
jgi:GNAT superfamily N-acetyltransferase